jgi:acyl-CoA synthetase (AMP-forming)/AMP-acid ligase II
MLPDRDLAAWRVGLFGAAPMPASAVRATSAALPHVELIQACGQTEGGPGGSTLTTRRNGRFFRPWNSLSDPPRDDDERPVPAGMPAFSLAGSVRLEMAAGVVDGRRRVRAGLVSGGAPTAPYW